MTHTRPTRSEPGPAEGVPGVPGDEIAPGVWSLSRCPSCGHPEARDLLPPDLSFDTTLELVFERGRERELPVDLSPFRVAGYVLCESCALVFCRRRSTPESAARYYRDLFHVLEMPIPREALPVPERFLRRRARIARDLCAAWREHGLLEGARSALWLRCDGGEGLRLLRDEHGVESVYGMDYLPSLLRHGRENLGLDSLAPLPAPEFENPFPRERFDLVVCNQTFAHAHDPMGIARALHDLVTPGGALVLYAEPDHAEYLKSRDAMKPGINFFHKQMFTRKSLRSFLALAGFAATELPHPVQGRPERAKNRKLHLVFRPASDARADLPSGEVDALERIFRAWWRGNRRRQRRERWLARVGGRRRKQTGGGGEARNWRIS